MSSGLTVDPNESIAIPLSFNLSDEHLQHVQVRIISLFGSFSLRTDVSKDWSHSAHGRKYQSETISPKVVTSLNAALTSLRYTVRVYDARPIVDYVHVWLYRGRKENNEVIDECTFPILIRRRPVPILTYRSSNELHDRVTIITKVSTFSDIFH